MHHHISRLLACVAFPSSFFLAACAEAEGDSVVWPYWSSAADYEGFLYSHWWQLFIHIDALYYILEVIECETTIQINVTINTVFVLFRFHLKVILENGHDKHMALQNRLRGQNAVQVQIQRSISEGRTENLIKLWGGNAYSAILALQL